MMDKGLILVIIGGLLSCTIYGVLIGAPLTLIGAYFLYKTLKNPNKEIEDELKEKQEELKNIDEKLTKMEADKEAEINQKLANKQKELDGIRETLDELEAQKTAEIEEKLKSRKEELSNLDEKYDNLTKEKSAKLDQELSDKKSEKVRLQNEINALRRELVLTKDELNYQSFGLYEPRYDFVDSTGFKEKLDVIRKEQKSMMKNKTAAICNTEWEVGGDKRKGKAMTNDNIKQILRTFNIECESIISKVKHNNLENSEKRIINSFNQLNKLNKRVDVAITMRYRDLKIEELYLAHEYKLKKEEEKELLREARAKEQEEKRLQKALEKERKKFERENDTITSEIEEVKAKMAQAAADEKAKLEAEIAKLQAALDKNNEEVKKINEWQETPGAGYVYIISNVGSFGEDVFKIGVTRRDNPEVRVRELSSASVPFNFDTHVFIFSKNAYELENELHKRFDKRRVNKVNMRKEFFHMSIDEVKQIVEENKGAVHSFVEKPDAEEYHETLMIEKQNA